MIHTEYGKIEGFEHNGCTVYLGIPFAKAPVGELAFRHPCAPEKHEGVLKAFHGSANPIQAKGGFHISNNSLDCLYLNVFVPQNTKGPLPVMVWIYGGSYAQGGAGAEEKDSTKLMYDLSRFAKETGCIAVSFNYRLNVYGFLNLHFLNDSFDCNNGLYDQIAALKYVKNNIAAFDGNPDNITVFGQSAGGACILALMCMKEAEGLFHKSIVQSACIEHFFTEEESRKNTEVWMKFAGVRKPEDLLKLSEERICSASSKFSRWMLAKGEIRCAFSPVIDGITLTGEPKKAVTSCRVPMLIGNTSEEGNLYLSRIPGILLPIVTKHVHLNVAEGSENFTKRTCAALTDHIYIRPQLEILKDYQGDAWRYEYCHVPAGSRMGSFHASELPALFGMDGLGLKGSDDPTGNLMRSIWGRFAKEGNPGWDRNVTYRIR